MKIGTGNGGVSVNLLACWRCRPGYRGYGHAESHWCYLLEKKLLLNLSEMEAELITQSSRMNFMAARLEYRILGAKECSNMRKDTWIQLQGLLAGRVSNCTRVSRFQCSHLKTFFLAFVLFWLLVCSFFIFIFKFFWDRMTSNSAVLLLLLLGAGITGISIIPGCFHIWSLYYPPILSH